MESYPDEVFPTITIEQPPQDEVACQVVSSEECDTTNSWPNLYFLDVTRYGGSVSTSTSTFAVPYGDDVSALTDGDGDPFFVHPDCGIGVGDLQLNVPGATASTYDSSASNAFDVSISSEVFHPEELGDAIPVPPPFSHAQWNMQTSHSYHPNNNAPYSQIPDGPVAEHRLPPGPNVASSNEGFCSPTTSFTPSNSPLYPPVSPYSPLSPYSPVSPYSPHPTTSPVSGTLSPLSPVYSPNNTTSPGIGIPSPSSPSSFVSLPSTTPDNDGGDILKTDPMRRRSHQDLAYPTRGRPVGRGRHSPSAPSSRKASPYERSSRSPNGPSTTSPYLDVPHPQPGPESSLMPGNPHLFRRHSWGAVSRTRPSFPGGGVQSIDIQPALPVPNGPAVSSQPQDAPVRGPVASPAIIAACADRRKREAKFSCSICPQMFTAKHNLVNHQKAHDGIKDQVCDGCRSSFTASGTLRRHMKTCKALKLTIG